MGRIVSLDTFQKLFTGNKSAYGKHVYKKVTRGSKEEGISSTVTNKLVTEALYKEHIEGKTGLGIVPIDQDSNCKFVVLDVDIYDRDLSMYIRAIDEFSLPIVPFYSKSGGLHFYIFFKTFIKAKTAVSIARKAALVLGISLLVKQVKNETLEIFPKQIKLSPNQAGSWINLPYFGGDDSVQKVISKGKTLSFDEGVLFASNKLTSIVEFEDCIAELPYNEAPPCLQTLNLIGGTKQNRNNYLFSFGVYLKKKDENYFEAELAEINSKLEVPLTPEELETTVMSSLRKKDYSYRCTASPCIDYCDKKICQRRAYGIGKDGGLFSNLIFGNMTQYKGYAPYYEWEVKVSEEDKFKRLRFDNEDEIIKQDAFLRLCMREIRFLPFKLKQSEWFKLVNQALIEMQIEDIDSSDDTSPVLRFRRLFFEFLTARSMATTIAQVKAKRVYYDKSKEEYLFRTKDLVDYLFGIKNFRDFSQAQIHGLLRDLHTRKVTRRDETASMIRLTAIAKNDIDEEFTNPDPDLFEIDFDDYDINEDF